MNIVTLTEAAAKRITELQASNPGKVVRLSVKSSGCSGSRYDLSMMETPGQHDEKVEAHGAALYVDPLSLIFVAGTEIDWIEDTFNRNFVFNNPNEIGRCGCGESFTIGSS